MAAWVFTISKERPQHWKYAAERGLWDTRRRPDVRAGDVVYFWQSGAGLAGRAIATSDLFEHADPDGPWDDAATGGYTHRFMLRVDADELAGDSPSWTQIREATGISQGLNLAPFRVSPQADSWLETLFHRSSRDGFWSDYRPPRGLDVNDGLPAPDVVAGGLTVVLDPEVDERERVKVAIALRQGQARFRSTLLHAYRHRCAITGWDVPEVLEAAHISPYRGEHTNRVQNGLLLRSDLHTLFDLHLLTVSADDLRVRLAPSLRDSSYGELAGRELRPTLSPDLGPSAELLRRHNHDCHEWFEV